MDKRRVLLAMVVGVSLSTVSFFGANSFSGTKKTLGVYAAGIGVFLASTFALWKGIQFLGAPTYDFLKMDIHNNESMNAAWEQRRVLFPEVYGDIYNYAANFYIQYCLVDKEFKVKQKAEGCVPGQLETLWKVRHKIEEYVRHKLEEQSYIYRIFNNRIKEYKNLKNELKKLLTFIEEFEQKLQKIDFKFPTTWSRNSSSADGWEYRSTRDEKKIIRIIINEIEDLILGKTTPLPTSISITPSVQEERLTIPEQMELKSGEILQYTEPSFRAVKINKDTKKSLEKGVAYLQREYQSLTSKKKLSIEQQKQKDDLAREIGFKQKAIQSSEIPLE